MVDARERRADFGGSQARNPILDTEVFVSIASLWELAMKSGLDKFRSPPIRVRYVQRQLKRQNFKLLDIDIAHIDAVAVLPQKHRDPFDRILIGQAKGEALTVMTADRAFAECDIATVLV